MEIKPTPTKEANLVAHCVSRKTIVSFLKQMAKQDNRGTQGLFYYVINSKEEYQSDPRNCDETKVYYDDCTYDSMEGMLQQMKEDGYEESDLENAKREACEYGVSKRWVQHGLFFTEDDAKGHLASNRHHYSKNAHTYVCHAWRAPKLNKFIEALFKHFEVDSGNQGFR